MLRQGVAGIKTKNALIEQHASTGTRRASIVGLDFCTASMARKKTETGGEAVPNGPAKAAANGAANGATKNASATKATAASNAQQLNGSLPSSEKIMAAAAHAPGTAYELDEKEFGPLDSTDYLYKQHHPPGQELPPDPEDLPRLHVFIMTYFMYLIMIILGHIRDFFARNFGSDPKFEKLKSHNGYAALLSDFDSFYTRRLKHRLADCFSRPTTGVPGRYISLLERYSPDYNDSFNYTGRTQDCLNLSSYNYLGFAQSVGQCTDAAEIAIRERGIVAGAARSAGGTLDYHYEVERVVADFVGKEAAMLFSMGYATNANIFANLLDKHCLVISDELNHASIRFGVRMSRAVIKVCKHNDMEDLERLIREQISQGQPRTHRPWKKIMVVVEGLYSMEGTMCNLPKLVELRDKYKFYLFVDEAHSIGAMGPHGRGVCDYFSISPAKVDILMGTLTKSFGATGGYVAGSQRLIDYLKLHNMANVNAEPTPPPVLAQIESSLKTITGEIRPGEGSERLQRLAFNSRYLRLGLKKMGFIVTGHDDSPIVPLMLYQPTKMPAFSREMLKRGVAVVVVGYPATPLPSSRVRFCVSSALTKADLDRLLEACDEIGDLINIKMSVSPSKKTGKPFRERFHAILPTLTAEAKGSWDEL